MKKHELTPFQNLYLILKDAIGRLMGAAGLAVLSPVFLGIIIAIKLEDGITAPVFFSQKRVGKDKKIFQLYKFRSMKTDTPHDKPTHMLENPEQYITKVGAFLRKTSLDELPQMYNIAKGDMAVIGPRPALWNQDDLIKERDKYGANDIKPGLTGWAQINGRDELEIPLKAKYDGFYVKKLGPVMDIVCFIGTIFSVARSEGVVEGGTGAMNEEKKKTYAESTVDFQNKEVNSFEPKKKLLVVTNHSYMLWQFRRELIEKLQEEYTVSISTPFVGHEDDFAAMGCNMIETDVDRRGINPVTDLKLIRSYDRILKEEKPDLVITYSIKPNIYAGMLCRLRKIPYAVNVQGLGTAFQKKRLAELVTFMYKTAVKNAKVVFFENEGNAKEFRDRKITPESQQIVLHGAGVNLEYYMFEKYPVHDDGKVHFLYLGRIMKEKGMDELFAAAERLFNTEDYHDFVIDLVGFFEDEYKEKVENLEEKGMAKFYGFQEDPRPFYVNASCIILPSYHEGMSNVLLEAAATGRALITSDIPGCREAVNDGKTGFLCNKADVQSLYEQMEKFMNMSVEERREMGIRGRQKIEKEFAKDIVVDETIAALR